MTQVMDTIRTFISQVWSGVLSYFDLIVHLPQLLREERNTFFLVSASLLVLVLLVVLFVVYLSRRKKKTREENADKPLTVFIPVESSGADVEAVFLPLSERILTCKEMLSEDVLLRIRKNNPKSLADIVSAYERATPAVKEQLRAIVREQRMMETYSRHLTDAAYPQGILVDAWRYFPDDAVLRSFVELLASRDEHLQMAAVRLLSTLKEPKSLPMLVLALIQPDHFLPSRVAEVFVSMPKQSAALLARMLPEIEDRHKEAVLQIIAQTGMPFEAKNVIVCLRSKNYHIRAAAALTLGNGRIRDALPELLIAANDKRWQVRAAAAKALGMIGDQRAVVILEALKLDKEGWVAVSAEEALARFQ